MTKKFSILKKTKMGNNAVEKKESSDLIKTEAFANATDYKDNKSDNVDAQDAKKEIKTLNDLVNDVINNVRRKGNPDEIKKIRGDDDRSVTSSINILFVDMAFQAKKEGIVDPAKRQKLLGYINKLGEFVNEEGKKYLATHYKPEEQNTADQKLVDEKTDKSSASRSMKKQSGEIRKK